MHIGTVSGFSDERSAQVVQSSKNTLVTHPRLFEAPFLQAVASWFPTGHEADEYMHP